MATVPYGNTFTNPKSTGAHRRGWKLAATAVLGAAGAWYALSPAPEAEETGLSAAVVHHEPKLDAKQVVGAQALHRCREALVAAKRKLESVPTMTAVFQKQERVGGKMLPLHVMDVKVRREPLSIYMKWQKPDQGQELLWREGAYDGQIVISPAGWRRKMMPMVKIDPNGEMAMASSKRPITNMGIWNFTNRLLAATETELTRDPALQSTVTEGDEISGRPCDRYHFELASPSELMPHFHKMTIYVDHELGVPVAFECHHWDDARPQPQSHLEESYVFADLKLSVELSDADFNHENPAYLFTAK